MSTPRGFITVTRTWASKPLPGPDAPEIKTKPMTLAVRVIRSVEPCNPGDDRPGNCLISTSDGTTVGQIRTVEDYAAVLDAIDGAS